MSYMFSSFAVNADNLTSLTFSEFPAGFGSNATNMDSMFANFANLSSSIQEINIYWSKTDMSNFDSRTGANKVNMFQLFAATANVGTTGAWMYTFSSGSTNVFKNGTDWYANHPNLSP